MRKIEIATRMVAGAQVLLCVGAALFACSACQRMNLGWLGAVFYSLLFVAVMRRWDGVCNLLLCAAVAVHAALVLRMASEGYACGFCIAATLGAVALVILRAFQFHGLLKIAAIYLIPLSLMASAVWGWVSPAPRVEDLIVSHDTSIQTRDASPNRVTMIVFENPDCPHCATLRREIVPVIESLFADRVAIRFVDARDFPAVRVTPTIVLGQGESRQAFEGLPTVQVLTIAIQQLLAKN